MTTVLPSATMRSCNRASWRSFDTNPFCSLALLLLGSPVDALSGDMPTADHANDDGSGIKLARFCSAANGRTLGLASADDDLTAISPEGDRDWGWAEDLRAQNDLMSSTTSTFDMYVLTYSRRRAL